MESEAERLEQELEALYAERDKQPKGTSFKSIVIAVAIIALLPGACGVLIAGPGGILVYIGLVLVFSLIAKVFSLGQSKNDVDKEITEKTATLANLRTINRDSEV